VSVLAKKVEKRMLSFSFLMGQFLNGDCTVSEGNNPITLRVIPRAQWILLEIRIVKSSDFGRN